MFLQIFYYNISWNNIEVLAFTWTVHCPIKKPIYDICNNVKGAVTSVINCVAMTRTRIGQGYYFKAIASSSSTVVVR